MADKKPEDKAPSSGIEVGQTLTAEGLAALRDSLRAELMAEVKSDPTFSDPNSAKSLDVGLHPSLVADVRQDLKDEPVPEGSVAMFCATDQRVVSESGHTFLFPKNTVQHIPKAFVSLCRKAGCAEVEVKK